MEVWIKYQCEDCGLKFKVCETQGDELEEPACNRCASTNNQLLTDDLRRGDAVIMIGCGEAEAHSGKVWYCRTDEFSQGAGELREGLVFLEGYSGSFKTRFLQKIEGDAYDRH